MYKSIKNNNHYLAFKTSFSIEAEIFFPCFSAQKIVHWVCLIKARKRQKNLTFTDLNSKIQKQKKLTWPFTILCKKKVYQSHYVQSHKISRCLRVIVLASYVSFIQGLYAHVSLENVWKLHDLRKMGAARKY